MSSEKPQKKPSELAIYGFLLAVLSLIGIMLAGKGARWEWWDFRTGFAILKYGAYTGLSAALISLIGIGLVVKLKERRRLYFGIAGLLIGILTVGVPWTWLKLARTVPPIHDITTDTENPPRFVAVLPLRENAPNSVGYGGPEIAKLQEAAYPDIVPAVLPVSLEEAFKRSKAIAEGLGWQIVATDWEEGRIEATDTTPWFGFKDDIVIRISPYEEGSLIDLRSVSRVGKSDAGTNAMRIRKFLSKL